MNGAKKSFEKYLVESQTLTAETLLSAQREALSRKLSLHQLLIEKGIIAAEALAESLARYHGVPYQAPPLNADPAVLGEIPRFTLSRYRLLPLKKQGNELWVATANPGNLLAMDELKRSTACVVRLVCTTEGAIDAVLTAGEGTRTPVPAATAAAAQVPVPPPVSPATPVLSTVGAAALAAAPAPAAPRPPRLTLEPAPPARIVVEDPSVAGRVEALLKRSIQRNASDIHLEPQSSGGIIRDRVDGVLFELEQIPAEMFGPMISRVKLLAGMDIVERRLAQDGRFAVSHGGANTEMRASTLPTIHGEKVVLRILRGDRQRPSLEGLDLPAEQVETLRKICALPDGLVLVAGPTGSGKTTTLYAMLAALDRTAENLITIEDPVEYEMPRANQVQVNGKVGITFASILPAILRQDPDSLLVGEVRDEETAQMVMRAAISGHLVFSTIHAASALQTVTRLMDMGVESHLVAAALKACLSQRLLRRLCAACKKPGEPTALERSVLGLDPKQAVTLYHPVGCPQCNGIGYSGRFAAVEALLLTDELADAVVARDRALVERKAREQGFRTLRHYAIDRVLKGDTSVKEVVGNCR